MVYKDKVYMWFKKSESHHRLELLCGLLNMCLPFELKYIKTFVEDLEKRDNLSREFDTEANNASGIGNLGSVLDERTRSKFVLYISLLDAANRSCSKVLFEALTTNSEVNSSALNDELCDQNYVKEMLLLYTMVLHHPAFSYEEKRVVTSQLEVLRSFENKITKQWYGKETLDLDANTKDLSLNSCNTITRNNIFENCDSGFSMCTEPEAEALSDYACAKSSKSLPHSSGNSSFENIYDEKPVPPRSKMTEGKNPALTLAGSLPSMAVFSPIDSSFVKPTFTEVCSSGSGESLDMYGDNSAVPTTYIYNSSIYDQQVFREMPVPLGNAVVGFSPAYVFDHNGRCHFYAYPPAINNLPSHPHGSQKPPSIENLEISSGEENLSFRNGSQGVSSKIDSSNSTSPLQSLSPNSRPNSPKTTDGVSSSITPTCMSSNSCQFDTTTTTSVVISTSSLKTSIQKSVYMNSNASSVPLSSPTMVGQIKSLTNMSKKPQCHNHAGDSNHSTHSLDSPKDSSSGKSNEKLKCEYNERKLSILPYSEDEKTSIVSAVSSYEMPAFSSSNSADCKSSDAKMDKEMLQSKKLAVSSSNNMSSKFLSDEKHLSASEKSRKTQRSPENSDTCQSIVGTDGSKIENQNVSNSHSKLDKTQQKTGVLDSVKHSSNHISSSTTATANSCSTLSNNSNTTTVSSTTKHYPSSATSSVQLQNRKNSVNKMLGKEGHLPKNSSHKTSNSDSAILSTSKSLPTHTATINSKRQSPVLSHIPDASTCQSISTSSSSSVICTSNQSKKPIVTGQAFPRNSVPLNGVSEQVHSSTLANDFHATNACSHQVDTMLTSNDDTQKCNGYANPSFVAPSISTVTTSSVVTTSSPSSAMTTTSRNGPTHHNHHNHSYGSISFHARPPPFYPSSYGYKGRQYGHSFPPPRNNGQYGHKEKHQNYRYHNAGGSLGSAGRSGSASSNGSNNSTNGSGFHHAKYHQPHLSRSSDSSASSQYSSPPQTPSPDHMRERRGKSSGHSSKGVDGYPVDQMWVQDPNYYYAKDDVQGGYMHNRSNRHPRPNCIPVHHPVGYIGYPTPPPNHGMYRFPVAPYATEKVNSRDSTPPAPQGGSYNQYSDPSVGIVPPTASPTSSPLDGSPLTFIHHPHSSHAASVQSQGQYGAPGYAMLSFGSNAYVTSFPGYLANGSYPGLSPQGPYSTPAVNPSDFVYGQPPPTPPAHYSVGGISPVPLTNGHAGPSTPHPSVVTGPPPGANLQPPQPSAFYPVVYPHTMPPSLPSLPKRSPVAGYGGNGKSCQALSADSKESLAAAEESVPSEAL